MIGKLVFSALTIGAMALASQSAVAAETPTLVVYSGVPQQQAEAVLAEFSKQYKEPVRFKVVKKPDEALKAQLGIEERSGGVKADLLWITRPQAIFLQSKYPKMFATVDSAHYADMVPAMKTGNYKSVIPYGLLLYVIAYNTKSINPKDVPGSYADLINEKYNNKLVMADPRSSGAVQDVFWFLTEHLANKPGYGWDYFKKLNAEHPQYVSSHGTVRDLILSGERPVGIQLSFYMHDPIAHGDAAAWNWPKEGVVTDSQSVSVFTNSKHKKIAEDVADWMLSEQGQAAVSKIIGLAPVNTKADFKFYDGKKVSDLHLVPVDGGYVSTHGAAFVQGFQRALQGK